MGIDDWIIILVALSFFGFLAWYGSFAEKRRKLKMAEVAEELGLAHRTSLAGMDRERFRAFELSQAGIKRGTGSVTVADTDDLEVKLFDYTFETGREKSQQVHAFRVVMVTCPSLQLPHFLLTPEGMLQRLGALFGQQDIDLPEEPAFSKKYVLKSDQEESILSFFDRTRCEGLLAFDGLSIEARGSTFIAYRRGKQTNLAGLRTMLQDGLAVYQLLNSERHGR